MLAANPTARSPCSTTRRLRRWESNRAGLRSPSMRPGVAHRLLASIVILIRCWPIARATCRSSPTATCSWAGAPSRTHRVLTVRATLVRCAHTGTPAVISRLPLPVDGSPRRCARACRRLYRHCLRQLERGDAGRTVAAARRLEPVHAERAGHARAHGIRDPAAPGRPRPEVVRRTRHRRRGPPSQPVRAGPGLKSNLRPSG